MTQSQPGGAGFDVRPADLRHHADNRDAIAAGVTEAGAAGSETISPFAYGQIAGQIISLMLNTVAAIESHNLGDLADAERSAAWTLRAMAYGYEHTDATIAETYERTRPAGQTGSPPVSTSGSGSGGGW
jgi:hypothetical protein